MRFKLPQNKFVVEKDVHTTKFLWFPKCCFGEVRWLETTTWVCDHRYYSWFPFFKSERRQRWLND